MSRGIIRVLLVVHAGDKINPPAAQPRNKCGAARRPPFAKGVIALFMHRVSALFKWGQQLR